MNSLTVNLHLLFAAWHGPLGFTHIEAYPGMLHCQVSFYRPEGSRNRIMYEARDSPSQLKADFTATLTGERLRIGLFCFRVAGGPEIKSCGRTWKNTDTGP